MICSFIIKEKIESEKRLKKTAQFVWKIANCKYMINDIFEHIEGKTFVHIEIRREL